MTPARVPVPATPQWLLARRLAPADRPMVLGDLDEQYQQQVIDRGRLHARLWYWREAVALAWGLWWWEPRPARTTWPRGRIMAMDDVKYAGRRLWKQPLATTASIATLACAIGAAAATWSLISVLLLHPLRIKDPESLFEIGYNSQFRDEIRRSNGFTYPVAQRLRDAGLMDFALWGKIGARSPLLVKTTGEARARSIYFASPELLSVVGVSPARGRFFSPDEDVPGGPMIAVLSDRFWRSEFGADPSVIGSTILVRDQPTTIVGVLPRTFRSLEVGRTPDLYMPIHTIDRVHTWDGLFGERPPLHWVQLVGRLPAGNTAEQMADRFKHLGLQRADGPYDFHLVDVETASLTDGDRADLGKFSTLLGGTVGLILAIGSLTVGMLLLMRTEARGAEFAMCLALGASRARLATGVIIEAVLLAVTGAVLAVPVSRLAFVGMGQFRLPGGFRVELLDLTVDRTVLLGTIASAVICVLVIAGVASLFALRRNHGDVLRAQAGATPRVTRRRSRAALVTAQVAVTLVLVSGAGLFASSVIRALSLNPGIDTDRLLWGEVDPIAAGYDVPRAQAFIAELTQRLQQHPAVQAIAIHKANTSAPLSVSGSEPRKLDGGIQLNSVGLNYVETMGLRIIQGRDFSSTDRAGAPAVGIVTASLARKIAGTGSPIGQHLLGDPRIAPIDVEIVGVVQDVRAPGGLEPISLFMPDTQFQARIYPGSGGTGLLVRPSGSLQAAIAAVNETVKSLDPSIRPQPMTTLDERIMDTMAPQRFGMTVMGALGSVALLLSVLGTYVIAESMAVLRRREMGIRAALGARGSQLGAILLSDTVRLVGAGLVLGLGLSWLGAETIRAFLFQVEPFDPIVTISVAVAILTLALAVSLRPALTAARLDLAKILRDE